MDAPCSISGGSGPAAITRIRAHRGRSGGPRSCSVCKKICAAWNVRPWRRRRRRANELGYIADLNCGQMPSAGEDYYVDSLATQNGASVSLPLAVPNVRLSKSGQTFAVPRMSAKCHKQTWRI
jgi:hypothetical protein